MGRPKYKEYYLGASSNSASPFPYLRRGEGKRGEGKGRGNPIPSISFPPPLFLSPLRPAHMGVHQPLRGWSVPLLAH